MRTVPRHNGGNAKTIEEILAEEDNHVPEVIEEEEEEEEDRAPEDIAHCSKCGSNEDHGVDHGVWVLDHLHSATAHLAPYAAMRGSVKRTMLCGMKLSNPVKAEYIIQKYKRKWA